MTLDITVTDLFCGAGGSSIGAERAGARLVMAANHWRLAIDTHNTNFPNANHDCADISQVNPRRYPRTDVLIASPECTNHSSAKTKRKATIWDPRAADEEERSRATMWDVVRFTEFHRYELVVVENVVEARNWIPFQSWLSAMHDFGYEHRQVYLNSMVAHPTPQSRDRMYVVFWRRGNPAPDLEFRPIAWCASCERDIEAVQSWKKPARPFGKYRAQYVYRCPACAGVALPYAWPAAAAIDWSLSAPRIGDRERPLADATVRRIRAGLERYGPTAIVQAAGHTFERPGYYRTWPTWQPLGTQTTTVQHALVVDTAYAHASDIHKVRPTEHPLPTQTAQLTQALVVAMRQGDVKRVTRADADPLATVVATAPTHALLTTLRGTSPAAVEASSRPATWPTGPQTTQPHDALVVPLRTHGQSLPADIAGHALLIRNYEGGAEMSKPVSAPTGTVTTRDHHSLLIPYHGKGEAAPVADPHRTVDTRDRFGLVEPAIEIDDCGFRMLEPHEIGRAMAFEDEYVVLGNKRERVRQYGNAVTPPVMSMLLDRAIASLAGGRAAS